MNKKLAVVTTHPIQYHVPWLIRLAEKNIRIKVFYTWEQSSLGSFYDPGFGRHIQWDIPLLEGYAFEFMENASGRPGQDHFYGIVNPELIGKIETWLPDALLVIGWNYHSHLQCLRYFHKRIPVYFRGDSVLLHEKLGWRKLLRRVFLSWIYHHVDYALYVGSNNRSYFLRHGMDEKQLVFSPQAMDIGRFAEPDALYTREAQEQKELLGISSDRLTVLFAGKMTRVKNPGYVLDLAEACGDLPVSFLLVGDGYLKEGLVRRAEGLANVHFLPFQNQTVMPAVYRMGDVYIMPSLRETWGMGVNEAMACGKPVMASEKVGSAVDLVVEGRTGMVFAPGDVDKCVDFLRRISVDRRLLEQMGAGAREHIQSFSFSHIVDSFAHVMSEIGG
jgi:glycosyltransferase involved in cell wall biosynthesis